MPKRRSKPRTKPSVPPQKSSALAGARLDLLIYLLLLLATFAVYAQVRDFDFLNYDDTVYVTENLHVRQGLSVPGLEWALTSGETGNWHPLTWLSLKLDVELFEGSPAACHATNLVFHVLNVLLLYSLLVRINPDNPSSTTDIVCDLCTEMPKPTDDG